MTVYASPEAEVTEKLAALAHEQWSHWMKYMFGKCTLNTDGENATATIPADLVARWQRQMLTPYAELPESEKESDRSEAARMLKVLDALSPAAKKALTGMIGMALNTQLETLLEPFGKNAKVGALIGGLFGAVLSAGADSPKAGYKCVICGSTVLGHACLGGKK